jgi:hypothetical protein
VSVMPKTNLVTFIVLHVVSALNPCVNERLADREMVCIHSDYVKFSIYF